MDSHHDAGSPRDNSFAAGEGLALLEQRLQAQTPAAQKESVRAFVGLFFAVTTPEELAGYSLQDLTGGTLAFWRFLQHVKPETSRVAVLNPEYENHGWQSHHTIVQIVHPDMPYIVDSVRMKLNEHGAAIHHLRSCVMTVERDKNGQFRALTSEGRAQGITALS